MAEKNLLVTFYCAKFFAFLKRHLQPLKNQSLLKVFTELWRSKQLNKSLRKKKIKFKMKIQTQKNTLFEIFIFCPKIQLWFPEKIVDFLGWKTRENVGVLDFLAVDNFDFTRKTVKKKFGWKTCENFGGLSKLNFWTKNWLFV